TIGLGLVGFVDDLIKVRRRRSLGLSKTAKIAGQAVVAVAFGLVAVKAGHITTDLSFIRDTGVTLGLAFYLWVLVIVAAWSNAVNLTDGLDGLASGSAILVLSAYVFIAFWQWRHSCAAIPPAEACYPVGLDASLDVAIVAGGAVGAVAGFLWWNAAPARIFMGDTGALALGGLVAALSVVTYTQLLLVVLGRPAGDRLPRLREADLPHVPDPSPLRARGLARVHRDRPVLDHRRDVCRGGDRPVLRGLPRERRNRMRPLTGLRVVVVGLGVAGTAAARALASAGARVVVTEERSEVAEGERVRALGVEVHLGGHRPEHLDGASAIVASPGVPERARVLEWARDRGIEI